MPVWLGPSSWIVATGWGIARWDGTGYDIVRYSRTGMRADQDPPRLDVFAVLDDDGRAALIQRGGEEPSVWRIGEAGKGELVAASGPRLRTAIGGGGGGRLVAATERGLHVGTLAGDALELGPPIALPAPAAVSWKSVLPRTDAKPPARDDRGGAVLGADVRLADGPHGITATSAAAGLVIVLDRATLAPVACLRTPVEVAPAALFALAVPDGVLVTVVAASRHTEYVLLARTGAVVASCGTLGKEPAWQAESEGVFCGETVEIASHDRLWTLALPTLRPRKHPGGADAYPIAHATTLDGARLVAYATHQSERPHGWRLVHTPGGGGRRRGREVSMPDFRPPPEPAEPATAARVVGPAALGLVADKTPWLASIGGEVELDLVLANRGGPVKGIYIELSGPVIGTQVVPLSISAPGGPASETGEEPPRIEAIFTGDTPRAELPGVALDAGYVEPTGKKPRHAPPLPPPPSVALKVKVRGLAVGNGLLMIRIGALAGGASAMQGRGITVG
jgi:hypothetical protein